MYLAYKWSDSTTCFEHRQIHVYAKTCIHKDKYTVYNCKVYTDTSKHILKYLQVQRNTITCYDSTQLCFYKSIVVLHRLYTTSCMWTWYTKVQDQFGIRGGIARFTAVAYWSYPGSPTPSKDQLLVYTRHKYKYTMYTVLFSVNLQNIDTGHILPNPPKGTTAHIFYLY